MKTILLILLLTSYLFGQDLTTEYWFDGATAEQDRIGSTDMTSNGFSANYADELVATSPINGANFHLLFNASTEYFSLADGDADAWDFGLGDYTIAWWIKKNEPHAGNIIFCSNWSGANPRYYFGIHASDFVFTETRTASSNGLLNGSVDVIDGEWHLVHFVFVRGVGVYFYTDGIEDTKEETAEWTDMSGDAMSPTASVYVGGHSGAATWPGWMAGVRVWKGTALTASQVLADYNSAWEEDEQNKYDSYGKY